MLVVACLSEEIAAFAPEAAALLAADCSLRHGRDLEIGGPMPVNSEGIMDDAFLLGVRLLREKAVVLNAGLRWRVRRRGRMLDERDW